MVLLSVRYIFWLYLHHFWLYLHHFWLYLHHFLICFYWSCSFFQHVSDWSHQYWNMIFVGTKLKHAIRQFEMNSIGRWPKNIYLKSLIHQKLHFFKKIHLPFLKKIKVLGYSTFSMSDQIYCKQTIPSWTKRFIATLGLSWDLSSA